MNAKRNSSKKIHFACWRYRSGGSIMTKEGGERIEKKCSAKQRRVRKASRAVSKASRKRIVRKKVANISKHA